MAFPFRLRAFGLLAVCLCARPDTNPQAPSYEAAGLVNSASGKADQLGPYTFATLYGSNLSYITRGRTTSDSHPSLGGVTVLINNLLAVVFYVSPTQVNLLIPYELRPGEVTIRLAREGVAGPALKARLSAFAPALFQVDPETVIALRFPSWALATREEPARRGEFVILYATGLGSFAMLIEEYRAPSRAVEIRNRAAFRVLLDGVPVEDSQVDYVGAVPDYLGLFQINLKLPEGVGPNPEIRIALGDQISPAGLRLPVE